MDPMNVRPKGLFTLLVLTFINTGYSVLSTVLALFFFKPTPEDIKQEKLEMAKSIIEFKKMGVNWLVEMLEKLQGMVEVLNHHFVESNLINVGISLLGAASAYFMMKRNHLGFHGYIVYNLLASVSIYFFVSPSMVPSIILIVNLLISLVFVLLYAKHLAWMKGDQQVDSL